MEIKNTTKYTAELNSAFQKAHFKKTGMRKQIIFTVLVIAVGGLFMFSNIDMGIGMWVFAVVWNIFVFVLVKWARRRANKNDIVGQEEPTEHYVFTDTEIQIETVSVSASGSNKRAYSLVDSVVVTDRFILIYLNKRIALLVDDNGYTQGSKDELVTLLKTKIPNDKIKGQK